MVEGAGRADEANASDERVDAKQTTMPKMKFKKSEWRTRALAKAGPKEEKKEEETEGKPAVTLLRAGGDV
ncbi:hypothetical protein E4U14_001992 [Claviceps sp. LM454 group G7]|nr:hypothetical protein E4U14_001992 [Claviceps sp. LM454 group G7]